MLGLDRLSGHTSNIPDLVVDLPFLQDQITLRPQSEVDKEVEGGIQRQATGQNSVVVEVRKCAWYKQWKVHHDAVPCLIWNERLQVMFVLLRVCYETICSLDTLHCEDSLSLLHERIYGHEDMRYSDGMYCRLLVSSISSYFLSINAVLGGKLLCYQNRYYWRYVLSIFTNTKIYQGRATIYLHDYLQN